MERTVHSTGNSNVGVLLCQFGNYTQVSTTVNGNTDRGEYCGTNAVKIVLVPEVVAAATLTCLNPSLNISCKDEGIIVCARFDMGDSILCCRYYNETEMFLFSVALVSRC